MKRIDTRTMPCPKPVLLARDALERDGLPLEILVDAGIPMLNVKRFLESRNISVSVLEHGDTATLVCGSGTGPFAGTRENLEGSGNDDVAILIASSVLGQADGPLGEVLIKAFLGTLLERSSPPSVIALMNEGVKLALSDSTTSESLRELEKKGCRVLVCGTCVKHLGIEDSVAAGTISNMFEITDALMEHNKTITLG
jgi:selenium metabolism protein YedF